MNIPEKYKLMFYWEGIQYNGNLALFKKAYFTGPVLNYSVKIEADNYIDLDLTVQNMRSGIFLPNYYYIARLNWGEVVYRGDEVELMDCNLHHRNVGSLKELQDWMRLNIDCSKHEHYMHHKFLVYPAWVTNEHGEELK